MSAESSSQMTVREREQLAKIVRLNERGAKSAEVQTQLLIGGLTTDDARRFVESIPSPEALMPTLALREIEGGQS